MRTPARFAIGVAAVAAVIFAGWLIANGKVMRQREVTEKVRPASQWFRHRHAPAIAVKKPLRFCGAKDATDSGRATSRYGPLV